MVQFNVGVENKMMCYRDKTFCPFVKCSDKSCHRVLTKKIIKDAKEFGLPICRYVDKPDCYKEKK
jgi:hypothetical protein